MRRNLSNTSIDELTKRNIIDVENDSKLIEQIEERIEKKYVKKFYKELELQK